MINQETCKQNIEGCLRSLFTVFTGDIEEIDRTIKSLKSRQLSKDERRELRTLYPHLKGAPNRIEEAYRHVKRKSDESEYWSLGPETVKQEEILNQKRNFIQRIHKILKWWEKEEKDPAKHSETKGIAEDIRHLVQQIRNISKNIAVEETKLDEWLDKYEKIRKSQ